MPTLETRSIPPNLKLQRNSHPGIIRHKVDEVLEISNHEGRILLAHQNDPLRPSKEMPAEKLHREGICRFMKSFYCGLICLSLLVPAVHAQDRTTGVGPPKPATDLKPATYQYQVTMERGGQTMKMKVSTVITDGGSTWSAVNTMETPQGAASDTATIAKSTLMLEKRSLKQGPVDIELDFAGNKATGKMSMQGQDQDIAVDLGGPIFADAAGGDQVIASLPLAIGYTASYRNFDLLTQKVKLQQLNVAALESITVPAGTFESYRVEVTSADGGADKKTLWVAKDSHKVVKISAVAASMGGAVLTEELTE